MGFKSQESKKALLEPQEAQETSAKSSWEYTLHPVAPSHTIDQETLKSSTQTLNTAAAAHYCYATCPPVRMLGVQGVPAEREGAKGR